MNHLPYSLSFCFRFNLHKRTGFLIEDTDIKVLSGMYGVRKKELRYVSREFSEILDKIAEQIRIDFPGPENSKETRLLCIGDSITSDRLSYANIIKTVWKNTPSKSVIDAGISGDTTSDLIDRHYSNGLNLDFTAASIFIGTNDARGHKDGTAITNTGRMEYERNLEYLITTIMEKGKSVINITIPPVDNVRLNTFFGNEANYFYRKSMIDEINDVIRRLSKKHGTHLADFAKVIAEQEIDVLDVDGIHLNIKGNESAARLVLGLMNEGSR